MNDKINPVVCKVENYIQMQKEAKEAQKSKKVAEKNKPAVKVQKSILMRVL